VGKKLKIDATDVSSDIRKGGGRGTHVPEGEYKVKINNNEVKTTKDQSGRYIRWECIIIEPAKYKGKTLYGNTSLKKDALWSLRNLIHAAKGSNIAGKVVNFDPDTLTGKVVGASVSDNEYEKDGKTIITSQIDSFFPKEEINAADEDDDEEDEDTEDDDTEDDDDEVEVEDDDDDEEEEEKPKKKAKKKKKAKDDDDDELEDLEVEDI
jgi:hypothetical protein